MQKAEPPLALNDVVNFSRVINTHHATITSLSYDGIKCIISADSQGYSLISFNVKILVQFCNLFYI